MTYTIWLRCVLQLVLLHPVCDGLWCHVCGRSYSLPWHQLSSSPNSQAMSCGLAYTIIQDNYFLWLLSSKKINTRCRLFWSYR